MKTTSPDRIFPGRFLSFHVARRCTILAFTFSLFALHATAQATQEFLQQLIEIITENLEGEGEFDYLELGEQIDTWQRRPVDINSSDAIEFVHWNIISEHAFRKLQDHIARTGSLLSVLELQSIDGFDVETVRILQIISHVPGREIFTQHKTLSELFLRGLNEFYFRAGRTLERPDAYLGEPPDYEGSPDKIYLRLRHRNGGLSYGITGEKDPGEAFFKGSNSSGFDYYSAHLSLQNYRPWLPAIVLGDFSVSLGQGLIMHSGFGAGKSSFVTSIKRSGQPVRPYTSVDENNFSRGAGITIKPSGNLTITVFGSRNRRDGNLITDTIRQGEEIVSIEADVSSLQTSNLHRTESEIADEDAIMFTQTGASVAYDHRRKHLASNVLYSSLDIPLNRSPELYNQFYFNGNKLLNGSLDYGIWLGGFHFFGETAMSDNGAIATTNGILAGLDKHVAAAILFRSFARDYHALSPNAFSENAAANNERGIYTALEITPSSNWTIHLYHDIWSHPWLRFNISSPSEGQEYFAWITYKVKRRLEIYAQFRNKRTNINFRPFGSLIPDISMQRKSQARLQINNVLHKSLQLRTRLEWSYFKAGQETENGFLLYQDFVYKPLSSPWTASARVTIFDTDGFDSRIYTYENDLIYYYSIPAFSDKGLRYYFNLRYKGIRNLTAEIKLARTQSFEPGFPERSTKQTEFRGQLIYRFEN